ncbi:excinuclease ABC subunit C [Sphingorhabdus lutea]|uniref:UvrABC system protein C n=1 Tax=Sphingorhabdus lutea TaxID=1913578 RepID=A0A1L3JBV5_9SPHN|nr:excinuclease ABC subunit UvrC [Sphingorhabdus lutea]APG62543.1 excinuclease ABC subunit C [Sphingorhabdus lutea]
MSTPDSPDRFLEDKAAYAVKGSERPDLQLGVKTILGALKTFPEKPGVYRMVDARGDVLYVGKARSLKKRVANYTLPQRLSQRLQRMISQTRNMVVVTTGSEAEALLLEAQLIKRYRPPYNVLLRDDKSFPYILLRQDHDFARIQKHRGARRAKGKYYGPFASAGSVGRTLNALQKMFLLRSCTDSYFNNRSRPCLLYQINRCSAPCVGRISQEDYGVLMKDAQDFLEGKSINVQKKLGAEMQAASDNMDFELAAILRDRLKALTFIQGSQAINSGGLSDADIFALCEKGGQICIQAFFIRAGQNWGHRSFFPAQVKDVPVEEVFTAFLLQFYDAVPPARHILLDREISEVELVAAALESRHESKVEISVPQRGEKAKLVKQAVRNAEESLVRKQAESASQTRNLQEITELFELDDIPQRIEIYDNSHIQGAHALGAMVVAGPEGFRKNEYRKFNIKAEDTVGGDDFAMMREVMKRRFTRLLKEQSPLNDEGERDEDWPDLLLIDGGKGQISSVMQILTELELDNIAVIGISKGPDRNAGREIMHFPDGREAMLPMNSAALFYLQRLRDEAHRFAIGAHRQKRKKAISANPLDEIPGIGPARKKALLMHFGSAKAVRNASLDDLQRAPGVSVAMAQNIYDFFHPN